MTNPDAVFKESKAELVVPDADMPGDRVFIGSKLPKNFKSTGWFAGTNEIERVEKEFASVTA